MMKCDCDRPTRKIFRCMACAACTNCDYEYYMVTDEVWLSANPQRRGMLCIGCLEQRLGRELTREDFTDAPLNTINLLTGSTRLRARLTQKKDPAII